MRQTALTNHPAGDPAALRGRPSRALYRKRAGVRLTAVLAALLLAALLAACSSSSKPALSSAQVKRQTCKQVEAALSDGPDPEADPVGHAQAQIVPLRAIHTTNTRLAGAISRLDTAYQQFTASKGSSQAENAVNSATKKIEGLCPGIEL